MLSQPDHLPADIAERAIEWLVDLQAEHVSPALLAEFQRWRSAHPDHERAWQHIESVNSKLAPAASPLSRSIAHAMLTPAGSDARRSVVAALTLMLFAGGAALAVKEGVRLPALVADHRTRTGERRNVLLDDGTQVVMNTATAINIDFNASERRVRLLAGEIFISTAKDAAGRPFLVDTGHGAAEALGTRYSVRLRDDACDIAVFDGAVRVTPQRAPGQSLVLTAGEQTSFGELTVGPVLAARRDGTAWIDGFIVARNMRLADFLAELKRYSNDTLSCAADVADLGVSGSYPVDDIGRVMTAVAAMLSLQVGTMTRLWGARAIRLSRI